jgi:hypothetical protein
VICKDLVREKYLSPLDDDEMYPQILAAWPELKAGIHHILESSPATVNCMTCIALFKLGFDWLFHNPKTVYISLSHDSSETGWPPVLAEIQSLLDGYGFNLHAHIEHNCPSPLADFPLLLGTKTITAAEVTEKMDHFNMVLPPHLETKVNAGADIGASTYVSKVKNPPSGDSEEANPMVGTLGCWLDIKVRDRGWRTVGLTNYHVVRPCLPGYQIIDTSKGLSSGPVKQDTALWNADREGLKTSGTKQRVQVESPTRAKLNFSVRLNRDEVKKKVRLQQGELGQRSNVHTTRITEMEAQEKGWLAFFTNEKHILGSVCFASGYLERTSQGGRLDWALIAPAEDSRVGQNLLPSMEQWRNGSYVMDYPSCIGGRITSPRQGTGSIYHMKKDDLVYKVGASTKCTIGKFEALKADYGIKEERYMQRPEELYKSTEFMFIGAQGQPFGRRGDSGSIVWDTNGYAVGLLFRGQSPGQSRGWFVYVTPIEDVLASIKAKSEGKIQDIRFLHES